MSFFDDASLVMIPSGYKTSKVYSVKPTDGSGDLVFSRSNDTATRVNSAGLIEKVRTNVVLRSEEQSNAQYAVIINEIASRVAVANPLTGQNNAYKITSTANNDPYIGQVVTGLSNGENTFSLWLWTDAGQSTEATLFFYNQTASEVYTKAITLTTTPTRFDHTVNFSNIGSNATVRLDLRQTGPTVQYLYTYGWQAESGVATAYIPTTSAAVSVGPVANVPRLDYLNSSCGRLLLEPQRTNVVTNSENGTGTNWGNALRVNVTANQVASPDGYVNADSIADTAVNGSHWFEWSFSATSGTAYTFSFFAKANTLSQCTIYGFTDNSVFSGQQAIFNVSNGTVVSNTGGGTTNVVNYGNGWYRVSLTLTAGATATGYWGFGLAKNGSSTYTGDGSSLYLWGIQLEAGAYATSYIPTLGAAVTRGADACSKTGISSLIGQTEGTLFVEFTRLNVGNAVVLFQSNDGTTNNRAQLEIGTSGIATGVVISGGAVSCIITGPTLALGQTHKVALSYKANDFKLYVNGVLAGTDTSGAVPISMSRIDLASELGISFSGVSVSQILNFTTALTNAQLAELTTI